MTNMSRRQFALALALTLLTYSNTSAQKTLDYADFTVGGRAGAYDSRGMNYQENFDKNEVLNSGLDFSDIRGNSLTRDGFVGRGESQHANGLARMQAAGCILTNWESVCYEVAYAAGDDRFRRVLNEIMKVNIIAPAWQDSTL